jgi:hypothetical protein
VSNCTLSRECSRELLLKDIAVLIGKWREAFIKLLREVIALSSEGWYVLIVDHVEVALNVHVRDNLLRLLVGN